MEAHEALVAGLVGLCALYAYRRRVDPIDRWFAVVALWICVTGILGLLLAQLDMPWRYVRIALRLTGPPLLLIVCEESVRTLSSPGSRRQSLAFAALLWVLATGGLIYRGGGALFEIGPAGPIRLQMGVTAWMAILTLCVLGAVMALVPAGLKRIGPGLGGLAAFVALASEGWAAIDPRWGTGAIDLGIDVSYRTLLTLLLGALFVVKARKDGLWGAMSGAALDPLEQPVATPGARAAKDEEPGPGSRGGEPEAEETAKDEQSTGKRKGGRGRRSRPDGKPRHRA